MEADFWAKVDRSGECWTWNGPHRHTGEPLFWYNRQVLKAHRVAYELYHGISIKGRKLRRICTTAFCVQPNHQEIMGNALITQKLNRPAPLTLEDRFWGKVDKSGDCWVWVRSRFPTGYGSFYYKTKVEFAHRVSYILTHGSIPKGFEIMHTCDNPPCVNPAHLVAGTHAENMQDRERKGRGGGQKLKGRKIPKTSARHEFKPTMGSPIQPGEAHGYAKLTWTQVREARRLHAECGLSARELARRYGMSFPGMDHIIAGRRWKDAPQSPQP